MVRQMPVCNAGGNAGATRETSLVQDGQRCPCNEGNDASATLVNMTAQCWRYCQRNAGTDASARLAKMPVLHPLDHQRPSCHGAMPGISMKPRARQGAIQGHHLHRCVATRRDEADACLTSSTLLATGQQQHLVDGHSGQ
jgi:hypothetical protein